MCDKPLHPDVSCAVQVIVMEPKKLLPILLIGAAVMVNGESFCV